MSFRIGRKYARHVYPEPQNAGSALALGNHQQGPLVAPFNSQTPIFGADYLPSDIPAPVVGNVPGLLICGVVIVPKISGSFAVVYDAAVSALSVNFPGPPPGPSAEFQLFSATGGLLVNGAAPVAGFYQNTKFIGPGSLLTTVTAATITPIEDTILNEIIPPGTGTAPNNSIAFGLLGLATGFTKGVPVFFGATILRIAAPLTGAPGDVLYPGSNPQGVPCGQFYAQEVL